MTKLEQKIKIIKTGNPSKDASEAYSSSYEVVVDGISVGELRGTKHKNYSGGYQWALRCNTGDLYPPAMHTDFKGFKRWLLGKPPEFIAWLEGGKRKRAEWRRNALAAGTGEK